MVKTAASDRPGRSRRRSGLTFLLLGTVLALAFAASAKWWVGYSGESALIDIGDGSLYINDSNGRHRLPTGWFGGVNVDHDSGRAWTWTWWTWGRQVTSFETIHGYSIWPLAPLALLIGGALYWSGRRAWRRAQSSQCVRCGYTLAGLPASTLCPECGEPSIDLAPRA